MTVIPPEEGPRLLAWWNPLITLARRARAASPPFGVYLEEFTFLGTVKRAGRPLVWVYAFGPTGCRVLCDDAGETYLFMPFANSETKGRVVNCDLDRAVFEAGVPFIPLEPGHDPVDDDFGEVHTEYRSAWAPTPSRPTRSRRRRAYRPGSHAHLRVLPPNDYYLTNCDQAHDWDTTTYAASSCSLT